MDSRLRKAQRYENREARLRAQLRAAQLDITLLTFAAHCGDADACKILSIKADRGFRTLAKVFWEFDKALLIETTLTCLMNFPKGHKRDRETWLNYFFQATYSTLDNFLEATVTNKKYRSRAGYDDLFLALQKAGLKLAKEKL